MHIAGKFEFFCNIIHFLQKKKENSTSVSLWNVFSNSQLIEMEVDGKSRVSLIRWSKTHPCLAIGTDKGGLAFYNKKNQKKIPTMGKHSKRIIAGDWNKEGLLSKFFFFLC